MFLRMRILTFDKWTRADIERKAIEFGLRKAHDYDVSASGEYIALAVRDDAKAGAFALWLNDPNHAEGRSPPIS